MKEKKYDVLIIGCGVAGMTAALYLKRSGVNCLIIEGETPGGQIIKTSTITNYPGFKKITGVELAQKMLSQLKELEVEILYKKVKNITLDQEMKKILFTDDSSIYVKNVIIATGRTPRKLNLANEEKLLGHGISYCATCDGVLFKNKVVAVIGGGDSALEEAIYLSSLCEKVILIHRQESFRAKTHLQEELKFIHNIEVIPNAEVKQFIEQDDKLVGVKIQKDRQDQTIDVSGCFVFIGFVPETSIFQDLPITEEDGYILVDENMQTSVKGIYAVGDVRKKTVCQIVTAINDGAIAAIHILKNIS